MPIMPAQAQEACRDIASVALRTPLIRCNANDTADLYLKLESLQPIGSFKIRRAANLMARHPARTAHSRSFDRFGRQHGAGVALCARIFIRSWRSGKTTSFPMSKTR